MHTLMVYALYTVNAFSHFCYVRMWNFAFIEPSDMIARKVILTKTVHQILKRLLFNGAQSSVSWQYTLTLQK